jgi:3-dehydroquinate dehydratase-1
MKGIPVKIVATVRNREEMENAALLGADIIEIRLDLLTSPWLTPADLKTVEHPPLIVTLRSRQEGGTFSGDAEEWRKVINPWLDMAEYIDVETIFHQHARNLQSQGKKVISSWHTQFMPTIEDLLKKEIELRSFGDLPKMVVTPSTPEDLLSLLSFTLHAPKPLCTGMLGGRFRYGRILLPLFGSGLVYCHVGNPAAEGQYHIQDFRMAFEKLLE